MRSEVTIPYIDTAEKASDVVARIDAAASSDGVMPLVFSTLADPQTRARIIASRGLGLPRG